MSTVVAELPADTTPLFDANSAVVDTDNSQLNPDAALDDNDGAVLVDDFEAAEIEREKVNQKTLKEVEKILGTDEKQQTPKKPAKQSGGDDVKAPAEGADQEPDELSQATKDRAAEAGLSDDLVERLHQGGLLEESLAAIDRKLIEQVGREKPAKPNDLQQRPTKEPPKEEGQSVPGENDAPTPLDAEKYEDDLVARDAFFQKRIEQLESQVAMMSQKADGFEKQSNDRFQQWFDKEVNGLNAELFGDGDVAEDSNHHKNRQELCDGYERICQVHGVDPLECHVNLLQRTYPAMFSNEFFKAAQRDTVQRLRDAQGKFVNPSRPSSGGPPSQKRRTPEEANGELVKTVEGILNRPER